MNPKLAPVQCTSLRAVGQLVRQGRRQDVAEMHLYDGNGHLVGHATGTFILLSSIPLGDNPKVPGLNEKWASWNALASTLEV